MAIYGPAWLGEPGTGTIDEISITYPGGGAATGPRITLTGDAIVGIEVGTGAVYTDAGATAAIDETYGDLSADIVVGGVDAVDSSTAGDYLVTYDLTTPGGAVSEQVTRTVQVGERPVITLHGPAEITNIVGTTYRIRQERDTDNSIVDPDNNVLPPNCHPTLTTSVPEIGCFATDYYDDGNGNWSDVTASDLEDGDLTARVAVNVRIIWTDNPLTHLDWVEDLHMGQNVKWEGEYHITYNATDSGGLTAEEVVRKLYYVEPDIGPVPVIEDDRGFCFINTASQDSSGGMLFSLSGLMMLLMAGYFTERTKTSTR
jgi:hypothetical protein